MEWIPHAYDIRAYKYHIPDRKLSNFIVIVTNISFPTTSTILTANATGRCGQYPGHPVEGTVGRVLCSPSPIKGRYVYITLPAVRYLMLCEVEVFMGNDQWQLVDGHRRKCDVSCASFTYTTRSNANLRTPVSDSMYIEYENDLNSIPLMRVQLVTLVGYCNKPTGLIE